VSDKLDGELSRLCAKLGCSYTRYADDISISSNRNKFPAQIARLADLDDPKSVSLSDEIIEIIESNGFHVNHAKSRLLGKIFRQDVTGLIVNTRVNVPRTFIRQIRSMLHDWETNGLASASHNHFKNFRPDRGRIPQFEAKEFQWVVRGKIEFVKQVIGATDPIFQSIAKKYNQLCTGKKNDLPVIETRAVLSEAVWYLENSNDTISTGTCFAIDGDNFVTCSHCVGPDLMIFPFRAPKGYGVPASVIAQDNINDVAIISAPTLFPGHKPGAHLTLASKAEVDALKVGDTVQLVGFPGNLNSDSITTVEAKIVRFSKTVLGGPTPIEENTIVLDGGTLAGMSGGPVIHAGKVVGVIARGPNPNDPTAQCEAVKATYISKLLGA
jgi:hypothetical protein